MQEEHQVASAGAPTTLEGSKRIVDINVEGTTPPFDPPNSTHQEDSQNQKPGLRRFLSFVGPGFLVSLAYLDPGNLETDLQAGANHEYELLWVILIGLIFALIIQSLAANLGVTTGKHLAELCKVEYPLMVKYCLWLLAEVAVIAADIPEALLELVHRFPPSFGPPGAPSQLPTMVAASFKIGFGFEARGRHGHSSSKLGHGVCSSSKLGLRVKLG
ncbi:hypothetical protein NL676_026252 [Syzygium grande]|nr:hypothetical protein NL676_026252 [Syzygium grande]